MTGTRSRPASRSASSRGSAASSPRRSAGTASLAKDLNDLFDNSDDNSDEKSSAASSKHGKMNDPSKEDHQEEEEEEEEGSESMDGAPFDETDYAGGRSRFDDGESGDGRDANSGQPKEDGSNDCTSSSPGHKEEDDINNYNDSNGKEENQGEIQNPYLNKMVLIVRGRHRGIRGRIIEVAGRGWWTIDNPDMEGRKVKNSECRMIDPIRPDELVEFCERTGTKLKIVAPVVGDGTQQEEPEDKNGGGSNNDEDCDNGQSSTRRQLRKRRGEEGLDRDEEWKRILPPDGIPLSWRDWRQSIPRHVLQRLADASIPPAGTQYSRKMPRRWSIEGDGPPPPPLPPVVISPEDDTAIPEAVRHLPPQSKVDIFDRKTGKVLSGAKAVKVEDLSAVLRSHAEYEPIVPPPSILEAASAAVREGRSGQNVTVGASVEPQVRVRSSEVEGREVIVTAGRLRGLVGRIEACLPGGWYVVSDLLANDEHEMDHVISSAHLDLLDNNAGSTQQQSSPPPPGAASGIEDADLQGERIPTADEAVDTYKSTVARLYTDAVRQLKLRIEALEEERDNIARDLGIDEDGNEEEDSGLSAKEDGGCEAKVCLKRGKAGYLTGLRIYQLRQKLPKLEAKIDVAKHKLSSYHGKAGLLQAEAIRVFGGSNEKASPTQTDI